MESSTNSLVSGGENSEGRGGDAGELGDSCTERGMVERKVNVRSEELGREGAVVLGSEGEANQAAQKMQMTKLRQEARRGASAAQFLNSHPSW